VCILFVFCSVLVVAVADAVSVCGADKVGLHVVDVSVCVHQELALLPFDLNLAHHNVVDHVHRLPVLFVVDVPLQLIFHEYAAVLAFVQLVARHLLGVERVCAMLAVIEVLEVVHHGIAAVLARLVLDVQAQDVLLLGK
jgi:hypothetical protein